MNVAPILLKVAEQLVTNRNRRRNEIPPKDPVADLLRDTGADQVDDVDAVQTAQINELRKAVVALANKNARLEARVEALEAELGDPNL